MKKRISFLILTSFILLSGVFSYRQNTGKLYNVYTYLWQYRILHPEVLPDANIIRLTSAWNTTSYADALWIKLIQYIWDNLGNNEYHNFLNPLIQKINALHPHFTEPYNIALMLSPSVNKENEDYPKRRSITEEALRIWEAGIVKNCDGEKLKSIYSIEFWTALWDDPTLKNPCNNPMLAYNVAITASELSEYSKARQYFKVASVEEEWPQAARFLWPLMDAKAWNNKTAWERFLLIAISGYDEPPYICQKVAWDTLKRYKTDAFSTFIDTLENTESLISEPNDVSNPIALSGNTCYGFLVRWIKQFFLAYIHDVSKEYPEITTGSGLLEKGLLKKIPTIQEQKGWSVIKKDGQWRYIE